VSDVAELIDRGVLAYVTGKIPEALAVFRQVLEIDPDNSKARGYLILVQATHPGTVAMAGTPTPGGRPERKSNPTRTPPPTAASPQPEPVPAVQAELSPPAPPPAFAPVPAAERTILVEQARQPERAPVPPAATVERPAPPHAPPAEAAVPLAPPPEGRVRLPAPSASAPPASINPAVPLPAPAASAAPVARPPPTAPAPLDLKPGEARFEHDEEFAPSPWDEGPASGATIVLSDEVGGGLDFAAVAEKSDLRPLVPQGQSAPAPMPGSPRNDVDLWLKAAKELFALGDFTGSLELIEKILNVDPDHGEARDYLRQNEATLVSMYESKLGPLHAIPRLAIKPEEVMWLNLDHRAGFLLAQIDGTVDYEGLFALSGLPRLDTARILANLIADGVVRS
jgi:tetratricopeptide (TPR) repeat protein